MENYRITDDRITDITAGLHIAFFAYTGGRKHKKIILKHEHNVKIIFLPNDRRCPKTSRVLQLTRMTASSLNFELPKVVWQHM